MDADLVNGEIPVRRANIIAGVAVFILGGATTIAAWLTLPYTGDFGPGPGFLPFWLGVALMVCAVPVVIAAVRAEAFPEPLVRPETARCLKVLVLIVGVLLSLPVLGFSAGLALITAGGMRIMGRHGWASCAATVIGTALCIHFLFGRWLSIPLPTGMIGW